MESGPMSENLGYLVLILQGVLVTLQLTVFGCMLALALAFLLGLARISGIVVLRAASIAYIEFFRGTSIFVQLFFVYFVLPLHGFSLTPMEAGILVLGLNVGACGAEVVRSGIGTVPREQKEACSALNLTAFQSMRYVILPQALVIMLPTLGNNAIELMKATAVVSVISLADMTFQAQIVRGQTGSTAFPFVTILLIYFLFSLAISFLVRRLETWLSKGTEGMRA
jgi:polar amino acid transport system permease protein